MRYDRTDIKLSFDKNLIKFYVDYKNEIIICTVEATLFAPWSNESPVYFSNKSFIGKGIAKCHKDDIFDIERGKRIALAKAENDAYYKASTYVFKEIEKIYDYVKRMEIFLKKSDNCNEHNLSYIESVSDPQNSRYKKELKEMTCGKVKIIK